MRFALDREEGQQEAAMHEPTSNKSTDRQWREHFTPLVEALLPKTLDMPPHALLTPEQQRQREVQALAEEVSRDEFLLLLREGVFVLGDCREAFAGPMLEQIQASFKQLNPESFVGLTLETANLDQFIKVEPELWEQAIAMAMQWLQEGKLHSAAAVLTVIAFCQNLRSGVWFYLGFALYQEEQYISATKALVLAHTLSPQQPEYSLLLAACQLINGEAEEARQTLQKTEQSMEQHQLQLSPEWEEMYKNLPTYFKS